MKEKTNVTLIEEILLKQLDLYNFKADIINYIMVNYDTEEKQL